MAAKERIEIIVEATDKASRTLSGIGSSVLKVGAVAGGAAVAGVTALGAGMVALAADAEPLIGLQQGFAAATQRAGVDSETFLKRMQEMSGGMITNADLMESYNKAASLVSDNFAQDLPDAMQLVQRAASSTGQDFGFLMDSLVTGVGRVSPMILDNLGIQVSLAEVTELAAEKYGIQAEEMDKATQQGILQEVVMQKLNDAYGNVPDVSQPFAKIRTSIENVKDSIGVALAEGLSPLFEMFGNLISDVGPKIVEWFQGPFSEGLGKVIDFIQRIVDVFPMFIDSLTWGVEKMGPFEGIVSAIGNLLANFLPLETMQQVWDFIDTLIAFKDQVLEVKDKVLEFLDPIITWIKNNVELKDVLLVLGAAIASVIIPAIVSFLAPIAAVVAAIAGLSILVAAVRKAWETDWHGIRTTLTQAWESKIKPALEQLWAWLKVNIPLAIETLKKFWEDTLLPAIKNVWAWISGTLIPFLANELYPWLKDKITQALQILGDFWRNTLLPAIKDVWSWIQGTLIPFFQNVVVPWLQEKIPAALQTLSDFWQTVLLPAIQTVWGFLKDDLFPLLQAIADFLGAVFDFALTVSAGIWQNVLLPAITDVYNWFNDNILPILNDIWDFLSLTFNPILEKVAEWLGTVSEKTGGLSGALNTLRDWFLKLKTAIENLPDILPDWMTPGSPTPLEIGLRGINSALIDVNRNLRPFNTQMAMIGGLNAPMVLAGGGGAARAGQSTSTVNQNYYLSVQSRQSAGRITDDFDIMQAVARRP